MEVGGTEEQMVFLEQGVNKDVSDQESVPGIDPDGKMLVLMHIVYF